MTTQPDTAHVKALRANRPLSGPESLAIADAIERMTNELDTYKSAISRLHEARDALKADAERFKFLTDKAAQVGVSPQMIYDWVSKPYRIDSDITDAAIAKEKP